MGRLLVVIGFVALAILAFLCINKHSPRIEDDLVKRTQQALLSEDIEFADVGIDGRDLILTGVAPNEVLRERTAELASMVKGVRTVNNQISLSRVNAAEKADQNQKEKLTDLASSTDSPQTEKALKPGNQLNGSELRELQPLDTQPASTFSTLSGAYTTEITQKDGHLVLSGMVPDETTKLWLVKKAEQQFGIENVTDQTKVVYGATRGWHATIKTVLENISYLQNINATLKDNKLEIFGQSSSSRLIDQIKASINESLSDRHTVDFNFEVEEPEPFPVYIAKDPQPLNSQPAQTMPLVQENYQTEIVYDSGKLVFKGHVPDQSARVWLTDFANETYGKDKVKDLMKIARGNAKSWYSTAETALNKLALLEKGKAILRDSELLISGQASSTKVKAKIEQASNSDNSDVVISYNILTPDSKITISNTTTKICQEKFNDLLKNKQILFDVGKADIKLESFVLLDQLAYVAVKECPKTKVEIAGHTDDQGNESYNQQLSELRAKSVVKYLQTKGVASNNFQAVGYGELQPIADNSTQKGMTKNRRIEFNVQGK
ncbi:MAG: OmpA family protein [Gammaproteobacteria bacterium]